MRILKLCGWLLVVAVVAVFVLLPLAIVSVLLILCGLLGTLLAKLGGGIARRLKIVAAAACLILAFACAARASKIDSFEHWTRYYEKRMGLEMRTEFRIGPVGENICATVGWEIGERGLVLVTYYDPDLAGCRDPWDVALNEACHRRMAHHVIGRVLVEQGIDLEAEALTCETWYRPRVAAIR